MKLNFSRRKFLATGALALGSLALLKRILPWRKEVKTAKFLAQDGTLVEVSLSKLSRQRSKVTNEKLVSWIWKDRML
jgi:hypothetical protein